MLSTIASKLRAMKLKFRLSQYKSRNRAMSLKKLFTMKFKPRPIIPYLWQSNTVKLRIGRWDWQIGQEGGAKEEKNQSRTPIETCPRKKAQCTNRR